MKIPGVGQLSRSSLFFVAAIISVVGGLARAKIVAVGLGVGATGALGQASTVVTAVSLLSCLGLWAAAAREFSTPADDQGRRGRTGTVLFVVLGASGSAILLTLAGGPWLVSALGLTTPFATSFLAAIAAAAGLANMAPVWWRSHRQGTKTLIVTLLAQTTSILLCLHAVQVQSLFPLAWSLVSTFAVPAALFLISDLAPRYRTLIRRSDLSPVYLRAVALGGLAGMISVATRSASDLFARAQISDGLGVYANGLAQPYFAYTSVLLPQFVSIMITAAIIGLRSRDGSTGNTLLRTTAALMILAVAFSIFSPLIVEILFSRDFLAGAPMLAWGSWVDVAKWTDAVMLAILVAAHRLRAAILISVLSVTLRLTLFLVLLTPFGITAVIIATGIEASITAVLLVFASRDLIGKRASRITLAACLCASSLGIIGVLLA